jgi:hypothetical protein
MRTGRAGGIIHEREVTNSQMLSLRRMPRHRTSKAIGAAVVLLACLGLSPDRAGAAERFPANPPMPVPRPHVDVPGDAPTEPVKTPPPAPSAPPATGSTRPLTELPPNDPFVRLGHYPRDEQREILRRCATEWDRMKRDGTVTGKIWRDYLSSCLPAEK